MKKKKIAKWVGAIFLSLLLYIMVGAVAPYVKSPEVSEETKKRIQNTDYLGKEHIMILMAQIQQVDVGPARKLK